MTSAGVTKAAAGTPATQPANNNDKGVLYPVSSARNFFI